MTRKSKAAIGLTTGILLASLLIKKKYLKKTVTPQGFVLNVPTEGNVGTFIVDKLQGKVGTTPVSTVGTVPVNGFPSVSPNLIPQ